MSVEEGNDITVQQNSYEILQNDGNIVEGTLTVKSADEYIVAESAELDVESIELIEGQSQTINIRIMPENITNTTVDWYSLDESVAKIKNGVVTAIGGGETTIYAKVCDSDIEIELPVKVIPLRELKFNNCTIADNIISVNVSANTILDDVQKGILITGLYDNDTLLQTHFKEISVSANEPQNVDYTFNEHTFDDINNVTVRAFWWNDMIDIKPLCKSIYNAVQ